MTHFVAEGVRTEAPEQLSLSERAYILLTGVRIPRPRNTVMPSHSQVKVVQCRDNRGGHLEGWWIPSPASATERSSGSVILCHGYAASRSSLINEAEEFQRLGWDTLLLDFHGSGGSSGSSTTVGYREAEDVILAVQSLLPENARSRPTVLYGMSMGSAAILRAVGVHRLKVKGVIVESPFADLNSTVSNRFRTMKLPAFPGAYLMTFWGGLQHGYWGFEHSPARYARGVDCDALLMAGSRDLRVSQKETEQIATNLSKGKLVFFPEAGHMPLYQADPKLWRTEVQAFLDKMD